jgi:hypothetical protein
MTLLIRIKRIESEFKAASVRFNLTLKSYISMKCKQNTKIKIDLRSNHSIKLSFYLITLIVN